MEEFKEILNLHVIKRSKLLVDETKLRVSYRPKADI
jgi:hypothetical protein